MSKRPKVLYLVYGEILSNVFESHLLPLWTSLHKEGVELVARSYESPRLLLNKSRQRRLREQKTKCPVDLRYILLGAGTPPRWPGLVERSILSQVRKAAPEIIHARGPIAAGLAATAIRKMSKERAPKLIFDVRGDQKSEFAKGGLISDEAKASSSVMKIESFERLAMAEAAEIITVSNPLKELIEKAYGVVKRTTVIPCWSQSQRESGLQVDRPEIRKELGIKPDQFVWTYVGSTAAWQMFPETIDLFAALQRIGSKNAFLIISRDQENVRQVCKEKGLNERDLILKAGDGDAVSYWLQGADAAVLLRKFNAINRVASPLKAADYLKAALPILSSPSIGDFSLNLTQAGAGVLTQECTPDRILEAAISLKKKALASRHMSTSAKDLFENLYAFEKYLHSYLEIYHRISNNCR